MSTVSTNPASLRVDLLWQRGTRLATIGLGVAVLCLFAPWVGGSTTRVFSPTGPINQTLYGQSAFDTGIAWLVVPLLGAGVLAFAYRRTESPDDLAYPAWVPVTGVGLAWLAGVVASVQSFASYNSELVTGAFGSNYPEPASGAMLFSVALLPLLWRTAKTLRAAHHHTATTS